MKTIRILTFWNVPNYGSFLQAYALQKVMEKRYPDCDVKQISHLHKKHFEAYYSVNKNFRHWLINPRFYKNFLKRVCNWKSIKDLRKFLDYYQIIPHTELFSDGTREEKSIDLLVLGSDILWDFSIDFFGKDPYLFGNNISAKRKISYAPSFGTVLIGGKYPEYVKNGLLKLDDISVREEKSQQIVKQICNRNSQVVLDPTLLWNFKTDPNIVKPALSDEYVIVYGSFFPQELINEAKAYCKKNNLKLVCLNSLDDRYDWCDVIINQNTLNPFEWAGYFKHAEAIMTCTFHGLMFGLIFNKRIAFHPTDFIMHKATFIIDDFGLKDVLVNYTSFEDKIGWKWDYTKINQRIEIARSASLEFLDRNINHE